MSGVENELTASTDAIRLTRDSFVFDGLALYPTLQDKYAERYLAGGVDAANVTFAAEREDWDETLRQIEDGLRMVERSPVMMQATCTADLARARAAGKLAVIVGTQGASMLGDQPRRVRTLHRLGMRFFGLAYTGANLFADGCGERRDAGVSVLGRELIEEVDDLDLILDLSHCGHRARAEAASLARHPVCTHSNAYAVHANDRNTKDETAEAIGRKGGVMGICCLPRSVGPTQPPTLGQLLDHADHWIATVGLEHVGLGFDFVEAYAEGAGGPGYKPQKWRTLRPDIFGSPEDFFTDSAPVGIHSIRLLPNLTQGLLDRGYVPADIAILLGGAWLRKFKETAG